MVFRKVWYSERSTTIYEMADPQRGQWFLSPKGKLVLIILPHQSQNFVNLNDPNTTIASTGRTTRSRTLSETANKKYATENAAKIIIHHRNALRLKEAFLFIWRM